MPCIMCFWLTFNPWYSLLDFPMGPKSCYNNPLSRHQDCIASTLVANHGYLPGKKWSLNQEMICGSKMHCINSGSCKPWFIQNVVQIQTMVCSFLAWIGWSALQKLFLKIRLSQAQDRNSWPQCNYQWTTNNKTVSKWWICILECCWIYLNVIFVLFVILYP